MATAVPVLPLLAAGVLDATAGRLRAWTRRVVPEWDAGGLVIGGAVLLLAVGLAAQQARFYFGTYADMDRWPNPTMQGRAVADQRPGALAMTIGRASHQINSGWVRLLAPKVERARRSVPRQRPAAGAAADPSPRLRPVSRAVGLPPLPARDLPGGLGPPLHAPDRGACRQRLPGAEESASRDGSAASRRPPTAPRAGFRGSARFRPTHRLGRGSGGARCCRCRATGTTDCGWARARPGYASTERPSCRCRPGNRHPR